MKEDCSFCEGTGLGKTDHYSCWHCRGKGYTMIEFVYDPEPQLEVEYTPAEYDRFADEYFSR